VSLPGWPLVQAVGRPTRARHFAKRGFGAVDPTSERRNARTWYAEASSAKQHLVMLVVASLMVMVLIAIAVVVLAVFGVSADGAL
jgi:hypothetical protein